MNIFRPLRRRLKSCRTPWKLQQKKNLTRYTSCQIHRIWTPLSYLAATHSSWMTDSNREELPHTFRKYWVMSTTLFLEKYLLIYYYYQTYGDKATKRRPNYNHCRSDASVPKWLIIVKNSCFETVKRIIVRIICFDTVKTVYRQKQLLRYRKIGSSSKTVATIPYRQLVIKSAASIPYRQILV